MKIKRVCHVTSVHGRYDTRIFQKECVSLAGVGYSVTLCVLDDKPDEVKDGVQISSLRVKPQNRLERFRFVSSKIKDSLLEVNADIYHLHDPELLLVATALKKKHKIVIFDSHENVPGDILDKEWIPAILRRAVSMIYSCYEANILKKIDAVVSTTTLITERISKVNSNTFEITNYPLLNRLPEKPSEIKPTPYICFAGAVNSSWMHENIIRAISKIEGVRYCLMGPCDEEYLCKIKQMDGWDKVDYLGIVPFDDAMAGWAGCIAGMAVYEYNNAVRTIGTLGNTKIFEIMFSEKPVICSDHTLWKSIVERENSGLAIDPYKVEDIQNAISYILKNPEDAAKMGMNGRNAIEKKYNWDVEEKKMFSMYEMLLENREGQ